MNQIKIVDTKAGFPIGTILQPTRKDTTFYYFDSKYPVKDGTNSTYQIRLEYTEEVLKDTIDLNKHRQEIDGIETRLKSAEGTIKTQGDTIAAQGKTIEGHTTTISQQGATITQQAQKITALETAKQTSDSKISELETLTQTQDTTIKAMEVRLAQLEAKGE